MPRLATYSSTIFLRRCANSFSSADVGGKKLLERLELCDRLMVRQIEMERRDGDVSRLNRFEVGAFARMPRRCAAADPVVRPTSRIHPLDHALGVDAPSELRDLHARRRRDGEVDVEDDRRIALMLERPADEV